MVLDLRLVKLLTMRDGETSISHVSFEILDFLPKIADRLRVCRRAGDPIWARSLSQREAVGAEVPASRARAPWVLEPSRVSQASKNRAFAIVSYSHTLSDRFGVEGRSIARVEGEIGRAHV